MTDQKRGERLQEQWRKGLEDMIEMAGERQLKPSVCPVCGSNLYPKMYAGMRMAYCPKCPPGYNMGNMKGYAASFDWGCSKSTTANDILSGGKCSDTELEPWPLQVNDRVVDEITADIDWGHSEPVVAIVAQGSPQAIADISEAWRVRLVYEERERLRSEVIEAALKLNAYAPDINYPELKAFHMACDALEAAQEAKP